MLKTNGTGGIAQTNAPFTPPSVGTVAYWMRGAGPSAAIGRVMGVNGDWEIRRIPGGTLSFDLGGSPYAGNEPFSTLDPVDTNGKWYHIAAVFDDTDNSYSVYIDGKLRTSGISPVDLVPQAAGVLSFGTRTGATEYWNGALRDVRIYSRKLCPTEIGELCGMVGYWKFDESSGSMASDSSGAGNNGTLNGPAWTTGRIAGGLLFNGTSQYVSVPHSSNLSLTQQITLATWVKSNDLTGKRIAISKGTTANNSNYWLGTLGTEITFGFNGSPQEFTTTGANLAANSWYYLAVTFDNATDQVHVYLNGIDVLITTTTATPSVNSVGLTIGKDAAGEYWSGSLDDVRVYNRVLCPTEVQGLFSGAPFTGIRIIKWVEIQ